MEYYYNEYKHPSDSEYSGQIDDEYYMLDPKTKTVTCLYKLKNGTPKDVKINLSKYESSWKFDNKISKFEYGKQLLQLMELILIQLNLDHVNFLC